MSRPPSPSRHPRGWWMLALSALAVIAAVAAFHLLPDALPPAGRQPVVEAAPLPPPPAVTPARARIAEGSPPREPAATMPPATHAPVAAATPAPALAKAQLTAPAATFLDTLITGADTVRFTLPSGETLRGRITRIERGDGGVSTVEGRFAGVRPGTFSFERLILPDGKAALRGFVMFESADLLYRLESHDGRALFVEERIR